ncbi:MAG TPA: ADP-forming succinate--CoA ligase subunit beta [Myxococcales bacterium]|nr:ADP-forming succinate--CoA ligase subunit beta [Myxococcales bacterium]
MKIHEYQAKEILRGYGVAVPRGKLVQSKEEAIAAAREFLSGERKVCVVKAQIHAGGRGKGGGVKLAKSPEEAGGIFEKMMGMQLVTHQTGPQGQKVRKVYVEEGMDIARELYLGITLDRALARNVLMASSEGGVEIEEVAATHPEKILRAAVDPVVGLAGYQARDLAFELALSGSAVNSFVKFASAMYRAYDATDASIVEINPLVVTKAGEVIALDAKINLDDNALFRHKQLAALRDPDEEDPREAQAKEHDLSYVGLEGNIGCMVNGAGLAMSTMDMIKLAGGQPANFLDVGGGADEAKVTAAFKLLLADPQVKAVLVNIFGGIMKCDVIAGGIIAAAKQVKLDMPLVVRLEGTNVKEGKALLASSGLAITPADDLGDAARKAVAAVKAST